MDIKKLIDIKQQVRDYLWNNRNYNWEGICDDKYDGYSREDHIAIIVDSLIPDGKINFEFYAKLLDVLKEEKEKEILKHILKPLINSQGLNSDISIGVREKIRSWVSSGSLGIPSFTSIWYFFHEKYSNTLLGVASLLPKYLVPGNELDYQAFDNIKKLLSPQETGSLAQILQLLLPAKSHAKLDKLYKYLKGTHYTVSGNFSMGLLGTTKIQEYQITVIEPEKFLKSLGMYETIVKYIENGLDPRHSIYVALGLWDYDKKLEGIEYFDKKPE